MGYLSFQERSGRTGKPVRKIVRERSVKGLHFFPKAPKADSSEKAPPEKAKRQAKIHI